MSTGTTTRVPPRDPDALRQRVKNYVVKTTGRYDEVLTTQLVRTVALVVLGQILRQCVSGGSAPSAAAIKGGTAMRARYGLQRSRASLDFDVVRHADLNTFLSDFQTALAQGWFGFQGAVQPSRTVSRPRGVPPQYIVTTYDVKLNYSTGEVAKSFMTVVLEVGADELDDSRDTTTVLDPAVIDLFLALGLPEPEPVHVVRDDHQIAQKLHAVSAEGSERAHDLIDLQLLAEAPSMSDADVAATCARLFRFRDSQVWPPTIVEGDDWESLYSAQLQGLGVRGTVSEAVVWANDFIARLVSASSAV